MTKKYILYRLIPFTAALVIGMSGAAFSPNDSWLDSWLHRDCVRWGVDPSEKLFTLDECKNKLHREVRYAQTTAYRNTGRVVMLQPVGQDRFLVVVYWDATPDDGKPGLRFYGRGDYENFVGEE